MGAGAHPGGPDESGRPRHPPAPPDRHRHGPSRAPGGCGVPAQGGGVWRPDKPRGSRTLSRSRFWDEVDPGGGETVARASGRGKGKWRESFREPSGIAPSALRLQGPSSICCAQKTLFQKPAPALILNGTAANGEVPRRSPVGPRSVAGSPMRGWGRTLGPPSLKGASGSPVDRPAFRSSGRQGSWGPPYTTGPSHPPLGVRNPRGIASRSLQCSQGLPGPSGTRGPPWALDSAMGRASARGKPIGGGVRSAVAARVAGMRRRAHNGDTFLRSQPAGGPCSGSRGVTER